jgi:hypothetical protein
MEPHITQEQEQMETIRTIEEEVSKIQPLEIGPHTELMEKEVKTIKMKVGTKPLVVEHVETTQTIVEETYD